MARQPGRTETHSRLTEHGNAPSCQVDSESAIMLDIRASLWSSLRRQLTLAAWPGQVHLRGVEGYRLEAPMSVVQDIRCKLRLQRWGPVIGDDWGAHPICSYCNHGRRLKTEQPPDAHDHLALNR